MAFKEEILIPKARIAVLIGQKGATKKMLEKLCKVKINVDSSEGLIAISGQDINSIFIAKDIVQAIGRGFSPDVAKELLKEGNVLDLINIEEYVRRNKNNLRRIRGVLIGTKGKTRRFIEEHTNTYISIYGKTVAIIGPSENVLLAHKAIEMFLLGASHRSVYKFLESHGK